MYSLYIFILTLILFIIAYSDCALFHDENDKIRVLFFPSTLRFLIALQIDPCLRHKPGIQNPPADLQRLPPVQDCNPDHPFQGHKSNHILNKPMFS